MTVVISDAFVVGPSTGGVINQPLSHARILYKSIATSTNVTATSSAAGFPAIAAAEPLTYEQWRPESVPATWSVNDTTARAVDAVGIYSPNIATVGGTIAIEYSLDNLSWTRVAEFAPSSNRPVMAIFNTVVAANWRVIVDAANGIPQISSIYIGQSLQMQRQIYGGLTPVQMARKTSYQNNRSDKGQWLGRSKIREGMAGTYSWRHLTAEWYRAFFDPFARAARSRPFFFAWYPEKYPQEVAYCWTTDDITPQNMGIRDFMEVSISVEGLQDD